MNTFEQVLGWGGSQGNKFEQVIGSQQSSGESRLEGSHMVGVGMGQWGHASEKVSRGLGGKILSHEYQSVDRQTDR